MLRAARWLKVANGHDRPMFALPSLAVRAEAHGIDMQVRKGFREWN